MPTRFLSWETAWNHWITTVNLEAKDDAVQLDRYVETSKLIGAAITKRRNGKANSGESDWAALVNEAIDEGNKIFTLTADDIKARKEKAAALKELYRGRNKLAAWPARGKPSRNS